MTRRALITGGCGGIGFAIAEAFATAGYAVTITGLTGEERAARRAVCGFGVVPLDVCDDASVAACIGRLASLDALINCAGIIQRGGREYTIEGFARTIAVNLTGTMRLCLAARPLLARSKGAIVNLASVLSHLGGPLVPAYAASKGGIVQLTKSLAAAWAAEGIRVNAIAPGWIESALTRPLAEDAARSDAIVARTPLARWGRPEDVAGAAVFLCSPAAAFVTGVTLPVDGGYLAV